MKEIDKKKTTNSIRSKRVGKTEKKDVKVHNTLNAKETGNEASQTKTSASDSHADTDPIEAYEKIEEKSLDQNIDYKSTDLENETKNASEGDLVCETIDDSMPLEAEKVEKSVKVCENVMKKNVGSDRENSDNKSIKVPSRSSSESSEGVDDKFMKEVDLVNEASTYTQRGTSDHNETYGSEEKDEHDNEAMNQKIKEMVGKIGKLEDELREVAALEISLYSVVPEHGTSAHKVHTPARRLSRLYIHACKHFTQDKRASIAKNIVSGIILIAKSCGNDVPRLLFWLSNTVVLREIIFQAFKNSCHSSSVTRSADSNGRGKKSEERSPSSLKWKGALGSSKQLNDSKLTPFGEDWQETTTFTTALEKVESWIFLRIVESVWWQTITPNMHSPAEDLQRNKSIGRLSGPALGDQQQGSFSINLWKNAFQDAFRRLCPLRSEGHECGCLPILTRKVMEQCVNRLDVAMFNAILRESAHEIPTDPISDPILDSKVLPIPAGDLSFGSGAQLKNSVGNWSRLLTDLFGMDSNDPLKENQNNSDDEERSVNEAKSFHLLNALSDLLMLPKDMLMDRSTREEICPSIGLPLIKRILCNFSPDEFCPDPVPGSLLEALNAESVEERRQSGESASVFPCPAGPVMYIPPSSSDVAEKVLEAGEKSHLTRNASLVQKKGYTSDEDLQELHSGNGVLDNNSNNGTNVRYELLRQVWLA